MTISFDPFSVNTGYCQIYIPPPSLKRAIDQNQIPVVEERPLVEERNHHPSDLCEKVCYLEVHQYTGGVAWLPAALCAAGGRIIA